MSCLIHARFNMSMDVMVQVSERDPQSGEIKRSWVPDATRVNVPCHARSITGGGIRVVGSTERWGASYDDVEVVKIQTSEPIQKRERVTNIRDRNGNPAWPDVFEVYGSMPIMDPFGHIVEYDLLVQRADVQ